MALFDLALFDEIRRMNARQVAYQVLNFAMIVSSALMIWKGLMVVTGSESPIVVVLSGSMEPAFHRGDLLLLTHDRNVPIRVGDITVFKIEGRDIPIVHRVIKVHEDRNGELKFLTKGDNNQVDDRGLYAPGQYWLSEKDVVGRGTGFVPYVGMVTILMNDYPKLKYTVLGLLVLLLCICYATNGSKVKSPVLDLNDKFLDVMNEGFWFIKFYAPWCAHCKRLAPTWDHLGHALEDLNSQVRVGKVDCTRFTTVCSALRVNAYPTLIFFRKGTKIPYEGERKKESMVDFVLKSSGPVVAPIETAARFSDYRKNAEKDPFFVFVDASEETEKDKQLFTQFEGAAEQLFTESRFTRIKSISILPTSVVLTKRPAIIVFKDGTHYVYDEIKYPDLFTWIQAERWPLIPQATPANIHSLGKTEKKIVLIVSDFIEMGNLSTPTGRFFKIAREAANLVRKDEYLFGKFQFAWLDGNQIANNIAMMEMNVPDLLVFNQSSYEFYLSADQSEESTPHSIVTFLQTVDEGEILPMGGRSWSQRLRRMYYDVTTNIYDMFRHQPILTVCLFGVPLAFFAIITYSICASDFSVDRDEIYPEDEDDSEAELLEDAEEEKEEIEGPRRRRKPRSSSRGRDGGSESDQSLIGESADEGRVSDVSSDHEKAE